MIRGLHGATLDLHSLAGLHHGDSRGRIVCTLVDPADLHAFGAPLDLSRNGACTYGFLLFWILGSACSALTCLLQRSPFELNRCPLLPESRPDGCPRREFPPVATAPRFDGDASTNRCC